MSILQTIAGTVSNGSLAKVLDGGSIGIKKIRACHIINQSSDIITYSLAIVNAGASVLPENYRRFDVEVDANFPHDALCGSGYESSDYTMFT